MDRKKRIVPFTSVKLIQVVLKNIRSRKIKNERGKSCSQVKKHSSYYFAVAVKSSGDISAELVREQKIEEHIGVDLDVLNDENRPSFNQWCSSRRTSKCIIGKHDG